jgi:hypothetical protein
MKLIQNPSRLFLLALLTATLLSSCGTTQTTAEKEQKALRIREMVASSHFTFNAEYAHPMNFRPIYLTSPYSLSVTKDTVQAFLPYYGRAYVAPMDPTKGGIEFSTTDFNYDFVKGKRSGNWQVTIKASGTDRHYTLYLDIWENGSARLTVNDPNRQSLSFEGALVDR